MHNGCPSGRQARHTLTRRRLLQVGGLGLLGSLLPGALEGNEGRRRRARAKSVIFLHQFGGPSHHDTFDMKPDAPEQVRGQYRPVRSSAPGVVVCEKLPRTARVMDKVTLVRSV